MSMCTHFWQILREVEDIVDEYKKKSKYKGCQFFFRGEYKRYPDGGDVPLPASECIPSLFRKECHYKNERRIFYEAIRRYPTIFTSNMTTFDMLATMQHYQVLTRLLDITSDVRLAAAMATAPFYDVKSEYNEHTAFVYVYVVKEDCIKYTSSDTVAVLSNLARLEDEKVRFDDLGSLSYEVSRERPGFDWKEREADIREDLKRVWCVLPIQSNERVRFQSGAFLLFGCEDGKRILKPSFSEYDFEGETPSKGIARVGYVTIKGGRKKMIAKELGDYVAMARHHYYPELPIYAGNFQAELENEAKKEN